MFCRRCNFIMTNLILLLLLVVPRLAASAEAPLSTHLHSFSEGLTTPARIAADAEGNVYVTDASRHRVSVLDAYGNVLRHIYGLHTPLGVAVDGQGRIYVGDKQSGSVVIFTSEGVPVGALGSGDGQFTMPTDIAVSSENRIYVVDSRENCVKVFGEDGSYQFQFGDSVFTFPTGIAIDEANDTVLVGQYGALERGKNVARVHIFDLQGGLQKSIGKYGAKAGEFTRIQGLAVDERSRIYVADCFQSTVQVVDYEGNGLSFIGQYGVEPGELCLPSDVALDPYNRLWVTSSDNGRVEVFGIDEYRSPGDPIPIEEQHSFTINLSPGINFVSVPLKPDEEWRLSDLAAHIGDDVTSIIAYRSEQEGASTYLPSFPEDDPTNVPVKGSDSYIIIMWKGKSVTFQGTAWAGEAELPKGMSMFAVPLEPAEQWDLDNLADHIGEGVTHLITFDQTVNTFYTYTPSVDPPSDVSVEGGMGCLAVMSEPKTVVFKGEAWNNKGAPNAAPKAYDVAQISSVPVLIIQGKMLAPAGRSDVFSGSQGVSIRVRNKKTGVEKTVTTNPDGDYVAAFVDFTSNRTANVGDAIQVKVADQQWTTQAAPYELTNEDVWMSHITLPAIQLEVMPKKSVLLRNYPNPANPETWIPYRLSKDADVRIEIYNVSGQLVRTLGLGIKEAGNYVNNQRAAYWDGRNEAGEAVASGVYFYIIRAGAFGATGRMAILK
ncbi:FlgD immunoglobulin-like domain containing protein [Candidatus Poribacteria bacterium]